VAQLIKGIAKYWKIRESNSSGDDIFRAVQTGVAATQHLLTTHLLRVSCCTWVGDTLSPPLRAYQDMPWGGVYLLP